MKKIVLITIMLLLSGCSTHKELSKTQIIEDYDYFWEVLEENFIYLDNVKETNIDVERIKKNQRDLLEMNENLTSQVLQETLYSITNEKFKSVAHLQVITEEEFVYYRNVINCSKQEEEFVDQNFSRFDLLFDNKSENYYSQNIDITLGSCETPTDYKDSDVLTVEFVNSNTILIVIPTFSHEYKQESLKILDDFIQHHEFENVIFDVRNNGGGSSVYAAEVISRFISESIDLDKRFTGYGNKTKEYLKDSDLDISEENNILHIKENIKIFPIENGVSIKELFILTENNYSASNFFVQILQNEGLASSYGIKSNVDVSINYDPMLVQLQNSGIIIRFDPLIDDNFLNESIYSFTLNPTVIVKPEESLQKVLDHLEINK